MTQQKTSKAEARRERNSEANHLSMDTAAAGMAAGGLGLALLHHQTSEAKATTSHPSAPTREPGFDVFAVEVRGGSAKPRRVDIFQHVDVDHRIYMVRDLTRDQWHCAAATTDMKGGGAGSEYVLRHERRVAKDDGQR